MKKYNNLSNIFLVLAVILSDVMCAATAYSSRGLELCYECSAPASTALLLLIPYSAAIVLCIALSCFFRRRANKG